MQSILIFALIGAVCMIIVTGGFISMTSDNDPSTINLASGAAVGGTMGAALAMFSGDMPNMLGGGAPDMKVGLPSF